MSPFSNIGGRSRVATRIRRERLPAAPPANIAAGVSYLETFTGSNGALGSVTTDLMWTNDGTSAQVLSNHLVADSFYGQARSEQDTTTTDQFVQIEWVTASSANDDFWIMGRVDNAASFGYNAIYLFVFDAGSGFGNVEIGGWNPSTAIDNLPVGPGFDPSGTWRLEIEGNEGRAYHDASLILTSDLSGLSPQPNGTKAAVYFEDSDATLILDNFAYGDL